MRDRGRCAPTPATVARQLVGGRCVVEGDDPAPRPARSMASRTQSAAASCRGTRAPTGGVDAPGRRRRHQDLDELVAVQRRRAPRPIPSPCARAGRRAGCRAARWRARRTDQPRAGRSPRLTTIGPVGGSDGGAPRPPSSSGAPAKAEAGSSRGRWSGVLAPLRRPSARRGRSAARGCTRGTPPAPSEPACPDPLPPRRRSTPRGGPPRTTRRRARAPPRRRRAARPRGW